MMAAHSARLALATLGWGALVLCSMSIPGPAAAAESTAPSATETPAAQSSAPLDQVTVAASKLKKQTLNRIASRFVQSHAAPSGSIQQIGRWRDVVCPKTTGLEPIYDQLVSQRIVNVAQSVGAPIPRAGKKCRVDIEIVFTSQPQALLNHVAKSYPMLLGSYRSAGDTTFRHAIESWYLTGTRSTEGINPPIEGLAAEQTSGDMQVMPGTPEPFLSGVVVDQPDGRGGAPSGMPGSHLGKSLESQLLHVFVVVDSRGVAGYSLRSISDYIAVLALTRMSSLDTCSTLPSIIDLLSPSCDAQSKPQAITVADTAYLKALYSSDLEQNLNVERGALRDRMVSAIEGH
ncbi:MAG: hypothetical protein WBE92_18225 [Steroidobacteraceae bacterium]